MNIIFSADEESQIQISRLLYKYLYKSVLPLTPVVFLEKSHGSQWLAYTCIFGSLLPK